jgi:hypothetical protein
MGKERTTKRITVKTAVRIGRRTLSWENDVTSDLGKIKIQNWNKMAMDRKAWKRTAEQAKTHKEL